MDEMMMFKALNQMFKKKKLILKIKQLSLDGKYKLL